MITEEDRAAPGIDMHCVSDKVDEPVDGRRRLTVTLQGEYDDEDLKEAVLAQLKQDVRMYAGEFADAVVSAMKASYDRVHQELMAMTRAFHQERDLRIQEAAELESYRSTLSNFGKALSGKGVCRGCCLLLAGDAVMCPACVELEQEFPTTTTP